jgi:hypothetical protein
LRIIFKPMYPASHCPNPSQSAAAIHQSIQCCYCLCSSTLRPGLAAGRGPHARMITINPAPDHAHRTAIPAIPDHPTYNRIHRSKTIHRCDITLRSTDRLNNNSQ